MENPAFVKAVNDEIVKSKHDIQNGKEAVKVYSFEEAISLTKTGKYHYFLVLVCGFCFLAVMMETMGVSILMPFIKCDLEPTVKEQGILASSGFFGIVLSSYIMGFLADTWGRMKTLRSSLMCSFATTVISAFSVNIWMLIVFRFFNGFFISGCQACVFSFLGEFHGQRTRAKFVTLLSTFMPIGLMFLPGVAIVILPMQIDASVFGLKVTNWRVLLLMNAMFSLVALCGLLLTPESPKFALIQGRHKAALQTLRKLFARNTGRPEREYPVEKVHIDIEGASLSNIHGVKDALNLVWSQTVPLFYKERALHTINICGLMFVIFGIGQGTFMWFPTMLEQLSATQDKEYLVCKSMSMLGTASTNSSITMDICGRPVNTNVYEVLVMSGAAFTILFLIFAYTIDIVGKKNLLMIWLFITSLSCLAIHWVSSFVVAAILLTLTMAVGNCGGLVSTISVDFFPTNISAMAMCLIMMCGRLGAVTGSYIFGVAVLNNCDTIFYIYVGIIAVMACLAQMLPDKTGKKKNETLELNLTLPIDSKLHI